LRTYRDFCDFEDGGRRHVGFSKIRNFYGRSPVVGQYVTVPNFVKIGHTVAEIWRFNGLFKMAVVRHLGFVKFDFFDGRSG